MIKGKNSDTVTNLFLFLCVIFLAAAVRLIIIGSRSKITITKILPPKKRSEMERTMSCSDFYEDICKRYDWYEEKEEEKEKNQKGKERYDAFSIVKKRNDRMIGRIVKKKKFYERCTKEIENDHVLDFTSSLEKKKEKGAAKGLKGDNLEKYISKAAELPGSFAASKKINVARRTVDHVRKGYFFPIKIEVVRAVHLPIYTLN